MAALIEALTPSAQSLPESGIVKVFNHGRNRPGLIPLWAGEGDTPTPAVIHRAATEALEGGQTFYTYQRGTPEIRQALAAYFSGLYERHFELEEFFLTCGGMQAIQMAVQLVVGPGDEVVVPAPAWPNFEGAILGRGGRVRYVPMRLGAEGWAPDLDEVFDACTDKTRALFINTPSNPTGWTASQDDLSAILDFARKRGLWIIADEIYGRFYFGDSDSDGAGRADNDMNRVAPSFQTLRSDEDKILFVQTFSKNWAMTGWRMGWLQAPKALGQTIENLIQYNTSGVPTFQQAAGVAALTQAQDFAQSQIIKAAQGRAIVCDALRPFNRVRFAQPDGAFYLLFGIEGETNSLEAALKLVDEANIGLAPGAAFGPGGEGHFRICFLRDAGQLTQAMDRLADWLSKRD